ncbi:hypothetical protein NEPAR06_0731 [Nematocida parisii]|uniref:Uncharacterized protein n=1 Tax=Nematocida parisii (strain ERTm3) TaxID=935791 RepID=I3EJ85_NEMP3|nr:hypothetical protein NEQG_00052 [Nematocida parisii ERTm3]KAI5143596.1 hypothetical protein NEPAR07_0696 [Nematocida parisii]KAI5153943.1 hypothetical protein NEPAR06_0731 [Nematocida parisii]KAI5155861.1 hypothetical protein NEPAR05_0110 [Nematocida parisii]
MKDAIQHNNTNISGYFNTGINTNMLRLAASFTIAYIQCKYGFTLKLPYWQWNMQYTARYLNFEYLAYYIMHREN